MRRRTLLARRATAAILSLAAATLPACSGSNLASNLAQAPKFEPKDQTKCGIAKSQSEPLIVEWPDAARGRLEALLRKGVVAVRYSGCEMEVLGQCSARGRYAYSSFTPKRSNVKMRDADELYANIPAYAVKFEAALQKAGELNVSMTIVGRYEADRASTRAEELEGQCQGATHVVNALTVGAFDFYAGADASVGGGVTVGGAGAGAKSASKRETLNQDGNVDACATSKRDDKEPPFGCGALIRVEVIPILGAGAEDRGREDAPRAGIIDASPSPAPARKSAAKDPEPSAGPSGGDKDSDGDGVIDTLDACPFVAGVHSSNLHHEGCPAPEAVTITRSLTRITEKVHFRTGSATIVPESARALDSVAEVMRSHPEIKLLEIQGHTDDKGAEAFALKLTQQRADSVKSELVTRRIAGSRLSAKGYGSSRPIASNATEVGRAQNRRVEFSVSP